MTSAKGRPRTAQHVARGAFQGETEEGQEPACAPPPHPPPRWGVSASLTRAARGRRHRARAADPDSVSPQDPPRCQIVVARLSARPVPALHVHIVKLGRVAHELKAPSLNVRACGTSRRRQLARTGARRHRRCTCRVGQEGQGSAGFVEVSREPRRSRRSVGR